MFDHGPHIHQLFDLTGHTALVTGAGGHLGFALASALAEAGARVVVTSREIDQAHKVRAALPGPAAHLAVALDHLDEASLHRGFQDALAQAGRLDILVNNAHETVSQDWSTITGEGFNRQLANGTGYFLLARELRNNAVSLGHPASVIMLGSIYGQVASYPEVYEDGAANPAAYHALKGGVLQMTRHLAVYWARDGVRVNSLSPGPFPPGTSTPLAERLREKIPLGRLGLPHELKGAVVFLASDASSFVTGHNLQVDGGFCAW